MKPRLIYNPTAAVGKAGQDLEKVLSVKILPNQIELLTCSGGLHEN